MVQTKVTTSTRTMTASEVSAVRSRLRPRLRRTSIASFQCRTMKTVKNTTGPIPRRKAGWVRKSIVSDSQGGIAAMARVIQ